MKHLKHINVETISPTLVPIPEILWGDICKAMLLSYSFTVSQILYELALGNPEGFKWQISK